MGVVGAGSGDRVAGRTWARRGYVLASLGLTVLRVLLPPAGSGVALFVAVGGAAACVAVGRRDVEPGRRAPWTLLLWALGTFVVSDIAFLVPDARVVALSWLIDAVGNALAFAAALALITRRGARDLGGIADAAVIGLAAGSVLWGVLPRRLGTDSGFATQVDLFVAVFALTGVLGALVRLTSTTTGPRTALGWLLTAIGLAIGGDIVSAIGGGAPVPTDAAHIMFMGAFTAIGLFGLDPTGPRLVYPHDVSRIERLTGRRLAFLGGAVAATSLVDGARDLIQGNPTGLILAVQGAFVAAVVMIRIGILGAERTRAEQALAHQATHDPLTQLPNRREFVARLRAAISRGSRCALMFCDLDHFKAINDRYGHDAGDRLLIEVAHALQTCVHQPHTVSRFGGDEFVILLVNVTPADAETTRDCVTTALARPFGSINGSRLDISIGIAHTESQRDPEQLLDAADHAMYKIKTEHRGRTDGDA
jgi:diguanylate cyclase (GGDEF)-like protein